MKKIEILTFAILQIWIISSAQIITTFAANAATHAGELARIWYSHATQTPFYELMPAVPIDTTDTTGRRGNIQNQNYNNGGNMPRITIYPNPATDEVTVATSDAHWGSGTIINVYNLIGERIYQNVPGNTTNSLVINTTNWKNGIYLFAAQQKGKTTTAKVVIEK